MRERQTDRQRQRETDRDREKRREMERVNSEEMAESRWKGRRNGCLLYTSDAADER